MFIRLNSKRGTPGLVETFSRLQHRASVFRTGFEQVVLARRDQANTKFGQEVRKQR